MKNTTLISFLLIVFNFSLKAQDKNDSTQIYLRNAYILDFQTDEFRLGNILIENDIISKINYGKSSVDKEGASNYNLETFYIIPGLIDAHVHLGTDPSGEDNLEVTKQRLNYLLFNGVTSVRDMAGDARYLSYLSRLALLDEINAPDIYFSALFAGDSFFKDLRTKAASKGTKAGQAPWMRAINSSSNLNQLIAEAKGTGATGIKVYADLDYNIVKNIVAAAHKQNMKVWAHATVFPVKPSELSIAGVDVLSHATLLAWEEENDVPTDAALRYSKREYFEVNNPVFTKLMKTLKANNTILDATVNVYRDNPKDTTLIQKGIALTKLAYQKKVEVGVGTDMELDDLTAIAPIFQEMNTLQKEVGMKPIDIIRAATIVNAKMIGKENSIGSIAEGKKANMVVLKLNPLIDIKNCSNIKYAIKNGKVFKKE
ncbi:amidohydrolase family protein [Aequorivita capsosiphonis]|uniref:amidohydrolase family protein n=1 Tax=Aequorivita capsosiphonis TaxID=487317 RepID=UPI0003FF0955|nr:amidohydrolase family protein [Aequorivita capsosiphonis]